MLDVRSVVLAVVLFAGAFLGVRWVSLGAPIPMLRIVDLKPDPSIKSFVERTREHIAADHEREWRDSRTAQGDGDPERARLREAVIAAATAFTGSPCNAEFKQQYFDAAAAYARAFMTLRGCPKYPSSCNGTDAQLEIANTAFRTPADGRVKEAVRAVHAMGIGGKDYPDRLGLVLVHLSDSNGGMGGEFSCTAVHAEAAPKRSDDRPATPLPPAHYVDNTPTRQDIDRDTREHYRKAVIDALRAPSPALCTDPKHRNFVTGVNQYYRMRYMAQHNHADRSREEQAEVERAWSTALDKQIDSLVQEFFVDGYLRPNDLEKSPLTDQVLAGLTWVGRACASKS
jgi:hypothetical protein